MPEETGFPQGETQYFGSVGEWRAAGSPEGTETTSVIIGEKPEVEPEAKAPEGEAEAKAPSGDGVSEEAQVINPSDALNQMLKQGASLDQAVAYWTSQGRSVSEIDPESSVGKMMLEKAGEDGFQLLQAMQQDVLLGKTPFPSLVKEFKVQPDWQLTEKTAQDEPSVYTDKQGIKHYAPASTMYQIGYSNSEEYGRTGAIGEVAPWVTVGNKQISKIQAQAVSGLSGGEQAQVYEKIGLLDTQQIKEQTPELYKILIEQGFDAYNLAQQQASKEAYLKVFVATQEYQRGINWLKNQGIITPEGNIDVSKIDIEDDMVRQSLIAVSPKIPPERLADLSPRLREAYNEDGFVGY